MNLHVFTTGRGTPTGWPECPVIKVATRTDLARRWHDLMDVNAGTIAEGKATIEEVGWQLFHLMLDVASGRKKTWAEHWKLHNALGAVQPGPGDLSRGRPLSRSSLGGRCLAKPAPPFLTIRLDIDQLSLLGYSYSQRFIASVRHHVHRTLSRQESCLHHVHRPHRGGWAGGAGQPVLIVDDDTGAIIDPGGNLAFNELFMGMTKHFPPQAVVPDRLPQTRTSLPRWTGGSPAPRHRWSSPACGSALRPHFTKVGKTETASSACPTAVVTCPWGGMNWCCCQPTSCTPKATSISTTRSARSCSRVTWACR